MNFKVGDKVVHLSHGVGEVTGIEQREFGPDKVQKFYILTIEDNGAPKKVFVPFENAETRIRPPVTKAKATEVLAYLALGKPDDAIDHSTWNRRYRDYMERIHTGELMEVAKVFVALRALAIEKDLSFGERKLADQAHTLLFKEFEAIGIRMPE